MIKETKVKEIRGALGNLDIAVNTWFTVNPNIILIDTKYSTFMYNNKCISAVLIIYKEGD